MIVSHQRCELRSERSVLHVAGFIGRRARVSCRGLENRSVPACERTKFEELAAAMGDAWSCMSCFEPTPVSWEGWKAASICGCV